MNKLEKDILLNKLNAHNFNLYSITDEQLTDFDITLRVMKLNGEELCRLNASLKDNEKIAKIAVQKNIHNFDYVVC